MIDILNMSEKEIKELGEKESKKAMFEVFSISSKDMPEDVRIAYKYISDNIYNSRYYNKDKYDIVFVKEYIPMMGMVWRCFIYNKLAIKEDIQIDIKRSIGYSAIISIYYDNADILGIVGKPYFEIYDRIDTERFLADEYKDLYKAVTKILKNKKDTNHE